MSSYLSVLKKYAVFNGRSRRKEYWMFVLFNFIFSIAAIIIDNLLGFSVAGLPYGFIYLIYMLAVLLPGLAASVRRLHDTGKSGWWVLISLVPFIGGIWLLVLLCIEGNSGTNQYGEDPKQVLN
ncbi:MAG: aminopeptidase [Clostridia bacterium]|jgi:uncharacterized membrane protein YhaH (DUF805 family)|nr:aminopeptidase [Clostridia bacterium]